MGGLSSGRREAPSEPVSSRARAVLEIWPPARRPAVRFIRHKVRQRGRIVGACVWYARYGAGVG
jgi:hypothetical protein